MLILASLWLVEGKHWTNIRQYFGYMRFENEDIVPLMNDLYQNEWSLLINYFLPSMKLIKKERKNGRVIKKHSPPKTPIQRLLESKQITRKKEKELLGKVKNINPFELQKTLENKIKEILKYGKRKF